MKTAIKPSFKGFSIRCPGRPRGSRAIDVKNVDLFPIEKVLAFVRSARRPQLCEDGARSAPFPPLLTGGERFPKEGLQDYKDFCDF